jgi:Zn-dependent protease
MQGSIRLFRVAGITVYLHFSWFIVGAYEVTTMRGRYESPVFAIFEYLALFALVLMHEFGHALACRQVGGQADRIVLWPLGGIAFVNPPPRAGAMLWSLAAGPLVNLVMAPILEVMLMIARNNGLMYETPDAFRLLTYIRLINTALLVFNLLPVYPLDGGQILRALLWFPLGPTRSLQIATFIGLLGGGALALYALSIGSLWIGFMAFFLLSQAWAGWQHAGVLAAEHREAMRLRGETGGRPIL